MPSSILDSFNGTFHGSPVASDGSHGAHISGSSTNNAHEPRFSIAIPVEEFTAIADAALHAITVRNKLNRVFLAPWETGSRIRNEGDVVASSAVYLNNPVQVALEATRPNIYFHRSEVTVGSTSRADKIYYRGYTPYAVLDYKAPGGLRRNEFRLGIADDYDDFAAWFLSNNRAYNFEARHAKACLKQAVHYSSQFNTPFVALFDWNTLILLILHQCRENKGGEYCYMTVVHQKRYFRKALFGFLLLASRDEDISSKLRLIRPRKEDEFKEKLDADSKHNESASNNEARPDRSTALKPPGTYTDARSNDSEIDDSQQRGRGRQSTRDVYYPPAAGGNRTKHVSG